MIAAAKALEALEAAKATAGRWHPTVNRYATIDEAVAAYRLCLESTPDSLPTVRGVMAWDHPATVIGSDPERPERATMVAIVGNGSAGEANAASVALRHNLAAPLAAVVRAVVECVEGNVHGAACFVEECDCVDRALKRALGAFNAAAAAQGFGHRNPPHADGDAAGSSKGREPVDAAPSERVASAPAPSAEAAP